MTKQQDLTWNKLEHFLHLVFTDRILASLTGKKNKHFEISQTLVRTGKIPLVVLTNTEVGKTVWYNVRQTRLSQKYLLNYEFYGKVLP